MGDVPFSIYYDFETTTGSAVYEDAHMHVVSYSMIVAFHLSFKMPLLVIYRACDQSLQELRSFNYLDQVENGFLTCCYHNRKTKQQFDDCAYSAFNKSRHTVFAELFAIELKFVCDALKKWFSLKKKRVEVDEVEKFNFLMNNAPQSCCLCNFPIDPFADQG